MDQEDLLDAIGRLKQANAGAQRAPHKPLLLLIALAAFQRGDESMIAYPEVDSRLGPLLRDFAPDRFSRKANTHDPFRRLPNDGLWELVDAQGNLIETPLEYNKTDLVRENLRGRLPLPVRQLLESKPTLASTAAKILLEANFTESLHDDIVHAVGLTLEDTSAETGATTTLSQAVKRDPAFRENVLVAYERMCAVCGFDLRLGNSNLGLEAAHIKWHAHGGPDKVKNGIALCTFHHKAFDKGAFKLAPDDGRFRIAISQDISGSQTAKEQLANFHGALLNAPQAEVYVPEKEYVDWHESEVFKGPARPFV